MTWATDTLIGCAIFGYIAYKVETRNLVYLKDFWRIDHPKVQKEGDIYCELHNAQVSNIVMLVQAGDVCDCSSSDLWSQRTRIQDYISVPGSQYTWCPGQPRVETYIHYQLVLWTVGVGLKFFQSSQQLVKVIQDAIISMEGSFKLFFELG
ncbi:hypothetical protein EDB83DRAFT_2228061 [Lactarius deliciosus]|nr:hypothetical protein EDB83DRAFT_2228061 [Lactarius deliciosus]